MNLNLKVIQEERQRREQSMAVKRRELTHELQILDSADGNIDDKISYSVWNGYCKSRNINSEIKNYIKVEDAINFLMKSIFSDNENSRQWRPGNKAGI